MINFTPPSPEYCRIQTSRQTELARAIVPALNMIYKPKSIIDIGCGVGMFLRIFADAATTSDYVGCDGMGYGKGRKIPIENFLIIDFTKMTPGGKKFDIVISLEVAEHIEAKSSDHFIDVLTGHAKTLILFSAATPGQGGDGHVNEQPHEYWHEKFKTRGFMVKDTIRPLIAKNMKVAFWYRKNIFLYEKI